ncbi:hypothetical protein GOODEAATRI_010860 [Goodea atripinnis]|uniref:ERAP1-like C-terminal domain-containing protein n=1 Tax=Goodea atripinnis TaxID=208336 RepID=A0ABV0NJ83_9TELE
MKASGSPEKWNEMFQRYKTSTLAQEKDKLLYGLASVDNVELLNNLLEATKDENVVRSQDLFTVVRYVAYNPLGQKMAWDWTTLNWDYLMEHFFKLTPDAGAGEMPRQQALETVRNNIEWVQRNKDEISAWLKSNVA